MSPQLKNPLDVMVITRERLQDTLDDAVRRGRMTRDGILEDEFPITDYDDLTAAQIVSRLGALEVTDLRRVRDYERRNANRKTVLNAVDAKLPQ